MQCGLQTPGLARSANGALVVFLSLDQPSGARQASNWLPAPPGQYYLVLRLYEPEQVVLQGEYEPPAVEPETAASR